MNPIETIKNLLTRGNTPQTIVENMVGNSNPIMNNLISMAKNGNTAELMKFGENIYKSKGKSPEDFKRDLADFRNSFN